MHECTKYHQNVQLFVKNYSKTYCQRNTKWINKCRHVISWWNIFVIIIVNDCFPPDDNKTMTKKTACVCTKNITILIYIFIKKIKMWLQYHRRRKPIGSIFVNMSLKHWKRIACYFGSRDPHLSCTASLLPSLTHTRRRRCCTSVTFFLTAVAYFSVQSWLEKVLLPIYPWRRSVCSHEIVAVLSHSSKHLTLHFCATSPLSPVAFMSMLPDGRCLIFFQCSLMFVI